MRSEVVDLDDRRVRLARGWRVAMPVGAMVFFLLAAMAAVADPP